MGFNLIGFLATNREMFNSIYKITRPRIDALPHLTLPPAASLTTIVEGTVDDYQWVSEMFVTIAGIESLKRFELHVVYAEQFDYKFVFGQNPTQPATFGWILEKGEPLSFRYLCTNASASVDVDLTFHQLLLGKGVPY